MNAQSSRGHETLVSLSLSPLRGEGSRKEQHLS